MKLNFCSDSELFIIQKLCTDQNGMLIEGGKSHHRPQLTIYFARSNNLLNSSVLFLDPPVQNPTTSVERLRWPHGKIEEVRPQGSY